MRWLVFVSFPVLLAGCGGSDSEPKPSGPDKRRFDETVEILQAEMQVRKVPGVSLAVVLDGKLAYSAALGVKSLETQETVTTSTRFLSASSGKMFVSAAVMTLAQEGKLDPKKPAKDYAPHLDFADDTPVTLEQLMTHTSGLTDAGSPGDAADPIDAWFVAHQDLPLLVPPGTLFNYTNLNYRALAEVVESVTGKDYRVAVRERVLEPAGMDATYDIDTVLAGDHAVGYGEDRSKPYAPGAPPTGYPFFQAAGGAFTTAEDYAHLIEGMLAGSGPLTPASVEAMTEGRTPTGWGEGWSYGYGVWSIENFGGKRVIGHAGFWPDFGCSWMGWSPEQKLGVVLLTNGGSGEDLIWLGHQLHEAIARFLDVPVPDFTTAPSTWSKYVGTYARPNAPAFAFEVTQDGKGALWSKPVLSAEKLEMKQGDAYIALTAGDTFGFGDFTVSFFPGPGGSMDYMAAWDFVAVRK